MTYSIARQYTLTPGPRYIDEGRYSGEDFRTKIFASLVKEAIVRHEQLIIDLDGTEGYGPSFLEETFGGLIREEELDYEDIKNALVIKSDENPKYKRRIEQEYLPNANAKKVSWA